MKRRIIRNIKAIDDPKDKFIHFFKTIKNLSNHTGDIKTLRDFKKSVNESFSYINEDYTFVKDKNKDNLYLKGKELYDSLSKHDKEFLGGHYIDSKNIYYRKIYTSGKDITGFGELYIFDSSPNDAVLMYAVSPDYRNKGLSNKILNDIFDFCKKDKNIHSIIWRANKNNDASNYLANKYKMKLIHSDDRDNKYSMVFNESLSYINEVKKFPI
jgi:RimJ/RimL family protein N-acetyltransferase